MPEIAEIQVPDGDFDPLDCRCSNETSKQMDRLSHEPDTCKKVYVNGAKMTESFNYHAKIYQPKSTRFVWHQTLSRSSLFWLPIVLIFLLPTLQLTQKDQYKFEELLEYSSISASSMSQLLVSLLRFPIDRLRFMSLGLPACEASTYSREVASLIDRANSVQLQPSIANERQDLQEEESHVLLLNPGDSSRPVYNSHRSPPAELVGHSYGSVASESASPVAAGYAAEMQQVDPGAANYGAAPESVVVAENPAALQPEASSSMATGTRHRVQQASTGSALQTRADLPGVSALNVKCEKNHMTVNIVFDRPFYGLVFSKGHYTSHKSTLSSSPSLQVNLSDDQRCVHLPANSGQQTINFDIHLGKCGMSSSEVAPVHSHSSRDLQSQTSANGNQQPHGIYIENTIIIQYDPQVQEIYDQARKLRCTWYDYYEKSVTFRPYNVDMLDAVTANFLGDNIQCWMQIQVGKGPWSSEVAGIVKIGQTMTMVLAIKDDENRFDMLVRNCVAHDGKHQPIQLVDEYGCVARPKIMGQFQKVRNFGPQATVVSYAHFQAFKFPDSMSVHFQCVIQVCRFECPPLNCGDYGGSGSVLPGPPSISTAGNQAGDYAASGTEVVASKEHPPEGSRAFLMPIGAVNSSSAMHHIKLDESQGKVQVKLDTSMLAGTRATVSQAPSIGNTQTDSPATPISGFHLPRGYAHHHQSPSHRPVYGGTSSGLASMISQTPSHQSQRGPQMAHYSPQYPSVSMAAAASLAQRAAYATNRIGELAPDARSILNEDSSTRRTGLAPEPTGSVLTLIATPRALRNPDGQEKPESLARNHRRDKRAAQQTTDIRTERTIQVVSPDDVAFSLLGSDDLAPVMVTNGEFATKKQQVTSTVCFSTVRLLAGILFSMALVIFSLVIAVYMIYRQQGKRLTTSKTFEPGLGQTHLTKSEPFGASSSPFGSEKSSVMSHLSFFPLSNRSVCSKAMRRGITVSGAPSIQQEDQRQSSYLTRIYSQFSPTNHWHQ